MTIHALTSVQNKVLHHENDVKEDRNLAQPELDRIPSDARPITLQTRIDHQLRNG